MQECCLKILTQFDVIEQQWAIQDAAQKSRKEASTIKLSNPALELLATQPQVVFLTQL